MYSVSKLTLKAVCAHLTVSCFRQHTAGTKMITS